MSSVDGQAVSAGDTTSEDEFLTSEVRTLLQRAEQRLRGEDQVKKSASLRYQALLSHHLASLIDLVAVYRSCDMT